MTAAARRTAAATLVALGLASSLASARAQAVRGAVLDEGGAPLAGAVVSLLQDGMEARSTVSDSLGQFRLRAPAAGRYALRVMRIGYRSTLSPPFDVAAGQIVVQRLVAPQVALTLPGVEVSADRRCVARPAEGMRAATLWEEAKKLLYATALTEEERVFDARLTNYERGLHKRGGHVLWERTWDIYGANEIPYASLPAEELSSGGYVRRDSSETVYYLPDARVLLSESFADDHCFRVERPRDETRRGLVGLAFEPVRGRRLPDVQGVLWMDARTFELRSIDYTYTQLPRTLPRHLIGGHLEFERQPGGAWIVRRWWVRMPILVRVPGRRDATVPGGFVPGPNGGDEVLTGLRERGGEVVAVSATHTAHEGGATIAGTVVDSTRSPAVPLAGAAVRLVGSPLVAVADGAGSFRLDGVPEGSYALTFSHPRLDSLGVSPPPAVVAVRASASVTVTLALRATGAALAACDGDRGARRDGEGAVAGVVTDYDSREPVFAARVYAFWSDPAAPAQGADSVAVARADSDIDGSFRLCHVPTTLPVRLRAEAGNWVGETTLLPPGWRGEAVRDLRMRRGARP